MTQQSEKSGVSGTVQPAGQDRQPNTAGNNPAAPGANANVQGEGDYQAARRFDREEKAFVESGRVDEAARRAAPESAEQGREMEEAERIGKSRSKGDDAPGAMSKPVGTSRDTGGQAGKL